jgi:DNA-binding CsgD family transcriptional regulator
MHNNPESLTTRELEVLNLIAKGNTTRQIADHLGITFKTACCHRGHVLETLGVHKAIDAVWIAAEQGLIKLSRGTEPGEGGNGASCGKARPHPDTALTTCRDSRLKLSAA